ncbi:hypothetical protein [Streptomyces sp. NPDC017556]|uniref:hypothetical protein n=1 Tax=Streptomyces sp. NPDC017556 TaxID=3365002 RepID=UPI0037BD4AD0
MLKRVFVAPDPGRVRLRSAGRGVLGVSLAVALCGLAGHSLVAAVAGGLAALLALFAVTDPTAPGRAVTTALLPVVGLPVLAVAPVLDQTGLRRRRSMRGYGRLRQSVGGPMRTRCRLS